MSITMTRCSIVLFVSFVAAPYGNADETAEHYLLAALACALFVSANGCAVGMAMSGKREPNLGAIRVGSTRGEVELQLGGPKSSATTQQGARVDIYEYVSGDEPSAGRAAFHAVMDLLTLLLWEIIGTPIEAFQGETRRLTIAYDSDDRVEGINQSQAAKSVAR